MQLLGRYVAVAGIEQQARQGQALTGGTQTRAAQTVEGSGVGSCCHPGLVDRVAANGHRVSASPKRPRWQRGQTGRRRDAARRGPVIRDQVPARPKRVGSGTGVYVLLDSGGLGLAKKKK